MEEPKKLYCNSPDEQLDSWVEGVPKHDRSRNECCPDFSCCRQDLLWSPEKRRIFAEAFRAKNHKVYDAMLMESLGALLASVKPEVYIAGQMPGEGDEVH